jgi:hypothetical protein
MKHILVPVLAAMMIAALPAGTRADPGLAWRFDLGVGATRAPADTPRTSGTGFEVAAGSSYHLVPRVRATVDLVHERFAPARDADAGGMSRVTRDGCCATSVLVGLELHGARRVDAVEPYLGVAAGAGLLRIGVAHGMTPDGRAWTRRSDSSACPALAAGAGVRVPTHVPRVWFHAGAYARALYTTEGTHTSAGVRLGFVR